MYKFVAVASCLVALSANWAWATPPDSPPQRTPDQYGRYVITFGPFARADVYLLDTQTGRVWRPVQYPDVVGEPDVWLSMDRIDNDTQFDQWLIRQRLKSKASGSGN